MAQVEINNMSKLDLKNIGIQELHLLLHNMHVYHIATDKRKQVIDEINRREEE